MTVQLPGGIHQEPRGLHVLQVAGSGVQLTGIHVGHRRRVDDHLGTYLVEHRLHGGLVGDVQGAVPVTQGIGAAVLPSARGDKIRSVVVPKGGDQFLAQEAVAAGDQDALPGHGPVKLRAAGRFTTPRRSAAGGRDA